MKTFNLAKFFKIKGNPESGDLISVLTSFFIVLVLGTFTVLFVNVATDAKMKEGQQAIASTEPSVSPEMKTKKPSTPTTPESKETIKPTLSPAAKNVEPANLPTMKAVSAEVKLAAIIIKAQETYLSKYGDMNKSQDAHYGGGLMDVTGDERVGYKVSGFGMPIIGNDNNIKSVILDGDGLVWFGYWNDNGMPQHVSIFQTESGGTILY